MGQQNKISALHKLFLYSYFISFPLLLMLATFIPRGIIKTVGMLADVVISLVSCEEPSRMLFIVPTMNTTEVTRPNIKGEDKSPLHPSQWYVPHFLGRPGPNDKALHKKLGNCVGKSRHWVGSRLLVWKDPLSTQTATRQDTWHIRALL